jgi:hypothetical protein
MNCRYVSIYKLEERVTYKMQQIYDGCPPITLYLRKHDCPYQVKTMLLIPRIAAAFHKVHEMNRRQNWEATTMYFTYFGCAPMAGGTRLSGSPARALPNICSEEFLPQIFGNTCI